jgi:Fatty acid desaturase
VADSDLAERHRFAPDILAAVRAASRPDNWHGPIEAVEHWAWIAIWCAASVLTWRHAPWWLAAPVYVLAVFFIGCRQRGVAGMLHMATHRAFMANHRAGSMIGAVLGYTGYRASHLGEHHGRLGDPERDPDYRQYRDNGLCGDDLSRRALRRHMWRVITPRATASYVRYLLRHRILTAGERPAGRMLRVTLLAAVLAWAVLGGWWRGCCCSGSYRWSPHRRGSARWPS